MGSIICIGIYKRQTPSEVEGEFVRILNYREVIVLCIDCYSAMRMWSKGEIQGQRYSD